MASLLQKKWVIKPHQENLNIFQNILFNRGIVEPDHVGAFLNPSYKKGFHNPFLMKDMDKAVARIKKAAENDEKVIIFGDYDVDGISGTAVLVNALQLYGANVSYRLPHRVNDGYGLNIKFIEEFKEKDIKLVITVDCGISCREQIEQAHKYGIDVIITDHHTIPEQIPSKAYAILHPKQDDCPYPFKGLTGSGVAYKLASALITEKFVGAEREKILYSLLDLASLGTVADLGPLLDENRIIVKYGLQALEQTSWQGLHHLMESAGLKATEKRNVQTIGFKIGPRINAAGRLDHPYYALQLLLHSGEPTKGKSLAAHLEKLNTLRQKMVIEAIEQAELKYMEKIADSRIFIAWDKDWHVGILGLIAGKFVEKYAIPCIILQEFDEHLVASFRSNEKFNAIDALTHCRDFLDHFGGHAQAAGFSIKKANLENFIAAISNHAQEKLKDHSLEQELHIDAELADHDINDNFMRLLAQMEPYGVGNHQPLFLMRNITPENLRKVGKEQNHLYFRANTGKKRYSSIAFKMGQFEPFFQSNSRVDLAFHLEVNEFQGKSSIQLRTVDARSSEL